MAKTDQKKQEDILRKTALRIFLLKHNDAKQHLRWSKTDLSKEIKKMLQEEIFYEF